MSEITAHPSDRWATFAASAATRDDASYPPAPIVYLWGPIVALVGLFVAGANIADTSTRATAMAISVAAGAAIYIWATRTAHKAWDARASYSYASKMQWLSLIVGDELTVKIADELSSPGAFTSWVTSCRSVSLYVSGDVLVELIVATAGTQAWQVPQTICTECHPRTPNGWRTNAHACDVTAAAVTGMLTSGDMSPAGYRAALRHELCTA